MSHSCFVGSFVEDVTMTKRVYEDDNISDEILNSVFDELGEEEQHGGSLFKFEFQKSSFPQHWKNTVHNQRYQSMLHQKRNPTRGDNSVHFDVDEIMNPLLCTSFLCHETWLHKDENRDTKQHNENVRLHES